MASVSSKHPLPQPWTNVLHRDLHQDPSEVSSAEGLYLTMADGRKVIDASGGAAVLPKSLTVRSIEIDESF